MKGKVLVGIPQYSGMIRASFPFICACLLEAQKRYPDLEIDFKMTDRIVLPLAHMRIVSYFLRNEFDHLFLVEEDVWPPKTCLSRRLDHNLDIVSALIVQRSFPYRPMLYKYDPRGLRHLPFLEWDRGKLLEVEFTGLGCILFKRRVFERVPLDSFKTIGLYADDFLFFRAVKKAGFKVFVDTSLVCRHASERIHLVGLDDYDRAREKLKTKSTWKKDRGHSG